ncbi:MAG: HIT family protein, partial [Nitriliruptorales bacterium]
HVHVVPRQPRDGLRGFFWPRMRYEDDAEAADVAKRIRLELESGR